MLKEEWLNDVLEIQQNSQLVLNGMKEEIKTYFQWWQNHWAPQFINSQEEYFEGNMMSINIFS
jgi:hypothetical protein